MRLVLLGDPVAHSRSPAMHQAALQAVGLQGTYSARRVDAEGMRSAAEQLRRGELDGANVTMPHKRLAARLADRLVGEAARTAMVNTLVRGPDGTIGGHNTDVAGVRRAFAWRELPGEAEVLVLGAGGAAAAALLALEDRRPALSARRPEQAEALLERLGFSGRVVGWGEGVPGAVVVNATPLGMEGEPLPDGVLEGASGLLDMAYGEQPTPAVSRARAEGIPVADGLDMLVGQGAASFRLWTGRQAPLEVMREAAARPAVAARPPRGG